MSREQKGSNPGRIPTQQNCSEPGSPSNGEKRRGRRKAVWEQPHLCGSKHGATGRLPAGRPGSPVSDRQVGCSHCILAPELMKSGAGFAPW